MPSSAPARLRAENQVNPLGLAAARPRLSWEVVDDRRGAAQTAWQVQAAARPEDLEKAAVWDSGKVASAESNLNAWGGPDLASRQRLCWRVRTWDAEGQPSPWSETAWLEAALTADGDWMAQWIAAEPCGGPASGAPAPYLRKVFKVKPGLAKARLYVTALGLVVPRVNGQRVGTQELAPGWQDFRYRVRYQCIDVGAALQPGENVLGAILGDGWYCGHIANVGRQNYGDKPRLLAQLELTYADGSRDTVISDGTWTWNFGANLENDLLMGQIDDLRREPVGWDRPGFTAAWRPVEVMADPGIAREPEDGRGIIREEELPPAEAPRNLWMWNSKGWIVDFGQNLVGRIRIDVKLSRAGTIKLRFGEMLDEKKNLYTANLRSARCVDQITADAGRVQWEGDLTCHGFRYCEISGPIEDLGPDAIRAVVLGAGLETTGGFTCSDDLVNRFQKNIEWGLRGNFLEVPTDCPQRDERLGWTGDAQVFCATAVFNRDVGRFLAKWQQDLADSQCDDGAIPCIAPVPNGFDGMRNDGGPAWSDAMVIVPWTMWRRTGDTAVIRQHLPNLVRYVDQLVAKAHELIRSHPKVGWGGFGDWLALDGSGKTDGGTPKDLIGTAYLAYDAGLLAEMAEALGETALATRMRDLRRRVTEAFRRRFVTPDGLIAGQTQTSMALALFMDLVPEQSRAETVASLVRDLEARGVTLATGFVGTPYLTHVLTRAGRDDLAWKLLLKKTFPSWLFPVTQGATTVWERWDGWTTDKGFQDVGMNSFNHYAYGAVGQWMYQRAAGLDQAEGGAGLAYRRLRLAPMPCAELQHASAWHRTPYGRAASGWKRIGETIEVEVTVPPGCTADLILPVGDPAAVRGEGLRFAAADGTVRAEVAAGTWRVSYATAAPAAQVAKG